LPLYFLQKSLTMIINSKLKKRIEVVETIEEFKLQRGLSSFSN
jgi:hypothetical protein